LVVPVIERRSTGMHNKRQQPTRRSKRPRNNRKAKEAHSTTIYNFAPTSSRVQLHYTDPTQVRHNSGTTWSVFTMAANDLYDPDPVLGGGSITGFGQWCGLYQKWRVDSVRVEAVFINKEAFPVSVFIHAGLENVTPTSLNTCIDYSEMPRTSKVFVLGSTTTAISRCRISINVPIGVIYGSEREYIANENFVGNGGASPASPGVKLYIQFLAYSDSNLINGLYTNLRLSYKATFFDRKPLPA